MIDSATSPSKQIQNACRLIVAEVSKFVYGYEDIVEKLFGAFVAGGHVLVEGPPGIAKTFLSKTFSAVLGLDFRRIQFTPDLMPSDITGVNMYDSASQTFRLAKGPIFTDILLADEINRTPPKTQAALLEAMEEHQVTIDGDRLLLSNLFFVIATQNPIEHEGTFPLPEAQLDRFLFRLKLPYPQKSSETAMIMKLSGEAPRAHLNPALGEKHKGEKHQSDFESSIATPRSVISIQQLSGLQLAVRKIVLAESVSDYIVEIARATRNRSGLLLGASPRAALNLSLAAKYQAAMAGRDYVIPDDVQQMCSAVLEHRVVLEPASYELQAEAGDIIADIVKKVPVPNAAAILNPPAA